jgi:hypothetical protein
MLRIGTNQYELVRLHSGFSVTINPKADDVLHREQVWELETHYLPADADYTPRADGTLEYLKLTLYSEEYAVKDWRKLSGLGLDTESKTWFGHAWLENLLGGCRHAEESWNIIPGWLEVERTEEYLFHCTFDGEIERDNGGKEDVEFEDDIPFRELLVRVPINAADPVATAQAMSARTVGLNEFAASRTQRYDPERKSFARAKINTHHLVTLETPWRHHPA